MSHYRWGWSSVSGYEKMSPQCIYNTVYIYIGYRFIFKNSSRYQVLYILNDFPAFHLQSRYWNVSDGIAVLHIGLDNLGITWMCLDCVNTIKWRAEGCDWCLIIVQGDELENKDGATLCIDCSFIHPFLYFLFFSVCVYEVVSFIKDLLSLLYIFNIVYKWME